MSRHDDIEQTIYHVLAAKFMAESAQDVGKDTDHYVLSGQRGISYLHPLGGIDHIRKRWEKEGAPKIPKAITEDIKQLLTTSVEECVKPDTLRRVAKFCPTAKKVLRNATKALAKQNPG